MTRIAVTLGDPRGIGPEVVAAVAQDPPPGAELVVVGPADLLHDFDCPTVAVAGNGNGADAREAGLIAVRAVEEAVRLVGRAEVAAICTAPANKAAFHAAGYPYPGHTELLAHLAGDVAVAMMLASDRLRVVLVTTHLPLADVPRAVTRDAIRRAAAITDEALRTLWGIAEPRIALCALNPHGGEGGLFGAEDDAVLRPAAVAMGLAGPHPADTVFVRALRGEFDAVLAPYHDVGMTAIKVASFGKAVNITLGLPFVRTSPDHGTAFDIAGKGVADPGSMWEAVRVAGELGERANAHRVEKGQGATGNGQG